MNVCADNDDDDWGRGVLRQLAEIGLGLAQALQDELKADAGKSAADLAMTFARVARAVRQTVALEGRLGRDETVRELRAQIPPPELSFQQRLTRANRARQRALVAELVGELIREKVSDPKDQDRLFDDLDEMLDDDDPRLDRPAGPILSEICGALGLPPDWPRWSQEPWAQSEAFTPGSPFARAHEAAAPPDS